MEDKLLYEIALGSINHRKLGKFGETGQVACALETKEGNVFTGICIDMPCSLGMCAEQVAIVDMIKNNETVINKIVAVYEDGSILPPCGRCREFIIQVDEKNIDTEIILSMEKTINLGKLLPLRWDG